MSAHAGTKRTARQDTPISEHDPEADPRHPGIEILRWLLRVAQ